MKHNIEDINLVMTCGACPELYIKDLPVKAMSDFNDIGRMFKYQCQTCGNECLQETRPDNTVCQPECTNPDWKLMKYQQHYKVGEQDFVLSEGEV